MLREIQNIIFINYNLKLLFSTRKAKKSMKFVKIPLMCYIIKMLLYYTANLK